MSLLLLNMICVIDFIMLNRTLITHFIASIPCAQKQIKSGVGMRLRAECLTESAFQSQVSSKSRHSGSLPSSRWNRRYFNNAIFSWSKQGLLYHQTSAGGIDRSSIWFQVCWDFDGYYHNTIKSVYRLGQYLVCAKLYDSLQGFRVI